MSHSQLREIPSVSALLEHREIVPLATAGQQAWFTRLVREVVDDLRRRIQRDENRRGFPPKTVDRETLLAEAVAEIKTRRARLLRPSLRRVINGTGVVVHTNLGRSLYPERAVLWQREAALFNCDLEFELDAGRRGHRGRKVEHKAALLSGAEDALIVNNNAGAIWLAVRHCARGAKVVLSRGEVVAIGGSFKMHEILAETGSELVEVGTTNRTGLDDYRQALAPGAVVLKVHRSNFAVEGFTEEVELAELSQLCRSEGHTLIYDAGSGALYPFERFGLPRELTLDEDLAAGVDLVTCSGDKLLGGCQAGLILGRSDLIAGLRAHPMRRAFRVDKTTLAALDAVLTLYLEAADRPALPTLDLLATSVEELAQRANDLLRQLQPAAPEGWHGEVVEGEATVGGGSFSNAVVPTCLLLWRGDKQALEQCHTELRCGDPALVTRMSQDGLAVDLRTITVAELPLVATAFRAVWRAPAA